MDDIDDISKGGEEQYQRDTGQVILKKVRQRSQWHWADLCKGAVPTTQLGSGKRVSGPGSRGGKVKVLSGVRGNEATHQEPSFHV